MTTIIEQDLLRACENALHFIAKERGCIIDTDLMVEYDAEIKRLEAVIRRGREARSKAVR